MHPSPSITTSTPSSAALTDLQTEVLTGVEVPANAYDAGVPLVTQAVPSTIGSDVKLAINVSNGVATDVSTTGHTVTLSGATVNTTESFVADGSFNFATDGDYVSVAQTTEHDLGANDFIIEFAGYLDGATIPVSAWGISKWNLATYRSWSASLYFSGGTQLMRFIYSLDGTNQTNLDVTINIAANEWHHYRWVRSGNTLYYFLDGKLVGTKAFAVTPITVVTDTEIGGNSDQLTSHEWEGYIDAVRLQVGGTVSTEEFSPARYLFGAARTIATPVPPEVTVTIPVFAHDADVATGDDKQVFVIPETLEGKQLRSVRISHATASSGASGSCDLQIYNVDQTTDILTTKPVIDFDEVNDSTGTAAVVDQSNNTATERERWRFDVDTIPTGGTQAKGLSAELKFQ